MSEKLPGYDRWKLRSPEDERERRSRKDEDDGDRAYESWKDDKLTGDR